MINDAPGPYCRNRLWEWGAAWAMIGIGILMDSWPGALALSKFRFMLDVFDPSTFTMFYLSVGSTRIIALYANGQAAPYSAYVRAIAAVGGGFAWFHMAWSLFVAQNAIGAPPSPTLPLLASLIGLELYTVYRALSDARYRYR